MRIGIDLGGSHIGIGVIDEDGKIIEKKETDLDIMENSPIEEFIKRYLIDNVKEFMQKYSAEIIGIASPGTPRDGKITTLVNLGIKELNIAKLFNETHIPVLLRNDAKCAGLAEKRYGSLKPYKDAVFICLGTGIGGAVFVNEQLLVPKRNPGVELGHMIIEKDGQLCNCGKKGCFETYCSMKRWKKNMIDLLELPKDTSAQNLLEILKEHQKEEKIQKAIDVYLEDLLVGLSNIVDIFEPEAICLGGSFVYFEEILYEGLIKKYYEKRYVFNKQNLPELKLATLGNDAGIIGSCIN